MANKEFMLQRICSYTDKDFDPNDDEQVAKMLHAKFNIRLPQRASFNDSLKSSTSDHEIINLILQYRSMD
jgi:DNA polymerase I-like protein with 3'-5' exonuclease and polymerase domains